MPFKRRGEPATIEDEREGLREQRIALEDLKRQLAERVQAVREREVELHHALAEVSSSLPAERPVPAAAPAAALAADRWEADTGENAAEAERREEALADRERAAQAQEARLAERERELDLRRRTLQERNGAEPDTGEDALEAERQERAFVEREQAIASGELRLAERERELEVRAMELAELDRELEQRAVQAATTAAVVSTPEQDEARLAQIEARLAELRDAEKLFLRTRDELADRSEAVAARERLAAQKERELDDREDGLGQWARPELTEMEARLRRLEQKQPAEQTLGFSGGLRKLQDGTTRSQRDA